MQVGGNFTTIPQFFKERGYRTAGLGKVFHDGEDVSVGWQESGKAAVCCGKAAVCCVGRLLCAGHAGG